jgi:hypothetical protein
MTSGPEELSGKDSVRVGVKDVKGNPMSRGSGGGGNLGEWESMCLVGPDVLL